jgi:1-aminocyclopropane-1-carboxylate deaminase
MFDLKLNLPSPLQKLSHPLLEQAKIELWIKRDDLIHPEISGNKWRKLALNLKQAEAEGKKRILTFGGAYSNHIAATAAIAKHSTLAFHAMIRGEELNANSNYCLQKAHESGLNLHFVSRSKYRAFKYMTKGSAIGPEWKDAYIIPEGGANSLGVKGCEAIYEEIPSSFDYLFCAAGTGSTAAGLLSSLKTELLYVVSVLKGANNLKKDILSWQDDPHKAKQLAFLDDYHFGGYGKVNEELMQFQERCKAKWNIELDYIYTAKAFYALIDLIKKDHFPKKSRIIFYHSGGLQANRGISERQSQ